MSSGDRRLVHERLKEYGGVETSSEGDEPNRYVVVSATR
jgi:predicted RNA-binding protein Jag